MLLVYVFIKLTDLTKTHSKTVEVLSVGWDYENSQLHPTLFQPPW